MTRRGKVLRDTTTGLGLLIIEGQQYRFSREQAGTSGEALRTGQVVDVELDARGRVCSITAVPTAQLTQEQAEAARRNENPIGTLLAPIVLSRLAGAGLLAAAWLIPATVSIQVPFPGRLDLTFVQALGLLNSTKMADLLEGRVNGEPGLYAFAVVIAWAGPFLPLLWKEKRAFLGGLLPLAFMIAVGIAVRFNLQHARSNGGGSVYGADSNPVSLALGAYLSILVSLYFVVISVEGWLAARRAGSQPLNSPQRKAA